MNTLPAIKQRAVQTCLSPVVVWQMLLARLLEQHYGLTLNDTPFSDEAVIKRHIEAGITLVDAVNFLVEKYELIVSVQREPSGHNLKHPTKWCPPNK